MVLASRVGATAGRVACVWTAVTVAQTATAARRDRVCIRAVYRQRRAVRDCYTRPMLPLSRADFEAARARMGEHVYHTPMLTSRLLSERTGYDVRLKAELFQRGGSYKIRGP